MNKKRIFVLIFSLLVLSSIFASKSDFQFHWSIGTAAISYGDESKVLVNTLVNDDFTRMVLSGETGLSAKLDKTVRLVAGGNLVFDSFLKGSQSVFFLDYAIFGGIRVYPNLGGLNFGLEYNTGRRSNFYNLSEVLEIRATENEKLEDDTIGDVLPEEKTPNYENNSTNWGNGFRLIAEYDFSYYTEGLAPVVGISYRRMPRGGFADNFFSFYFRLAF